jgi:hypothetical protein
MHQYSHGKQTPKDPAPLPKKRNERGGKDKRPEIDLEQDNFQDKQGPQKYQASEKHRNARHNSRTPQTFIPWRNQQRRWNGMKKQALEHGGRGTKL